MKALRRIPWRVKGFRFHGDGSMTVPAEWDGFLPPVELAHGYPPKPVSARIYDVPAAGVHVLAPASLEEALDAIEKPEDCSDENCWRHGGKGSCRCDDETEGGVWQPGC